MEKSIRHEINDLKAAIAISKEESAKEVLAESMRIATLKDGLLEARRSTKGEEDYIQELESVKEKERSTLLENEEKNLIIRRDRYE